MLSVTCHMSCVTCQVSHIICHMYFSFLLFFGQRGEAYWRLLYQQGLPRLVFKFSPTRPSGPSWSSSSEECFFVCLSVCLPDVPFSCNFFFVVGLVQSVLCLWTGAISILISSRALKTRICSGVRSRSRSRSRVEP